MKQDILLDLTNNLCGIFGKFVNDGKCTISFKLPEVNLQIKADPIQLKAFLNVMKNELNADSNSINNNQDGSNKMIRAFASTNKMITEQVTKLTITKRSEFPTKGFPRTLRELRINEVGCLQMPIGILNLTNLTHLDLSNNQISRIHKSLGNLRLTQLNLSNNVINEWQWMNGKNLQTSLQYLNLSKNKLKMICGLVGCFENLVNLDLSFNEIEQLPFAIQQMKQLRNFNLSNNQLKHLPSSIMNLNLDVIDISKNQFTAIEDVQKYRFDMRQQFTQEFVFPNLFELASRVVIRQKIKYMHQNIPQIIKDILFYSPNCARCGTFCFDREIFQNILTTPINAKSRVTDNNEKYFKSYGPLCSLKCLWTTISQNL